MAKDKSTSTIQSDSLQHFENSFIYLPVIFYTPETKTAFGASMSHFFYPGQKMKNRPSSLTPTFIYTTRKQILAELKTDLYMQDNHLIGEFQFLKFPETFMGIGNKTSDDEEENFTSQSVNLFLSYQKEISPGLYVGPRYFFRDTKILKTADDGILKNKTILGSKNGTTSGLGLAVHYDTRDNVFYPTDGVFHQLSGWVFTDFMGSDYNFRKLNLDMRLYRTFYTNHVLALRTYFESSFGNVPFQSMAMVGGANLMRGYFQGRYRDKNMLALQAEYRMPLFWNFGLAGFAGLGDVSSEIQKFEVSNFKHCYGFGIRYQIDPKSKLNLRLDFGFGKNSSGTYISISEAF
jgi:outer membrane protein assembly factor BamA